MVRVNERYIGRVEYRVFYSSPSDRRTGRPRAYNLLYFCAAFLDVHHFNNSTDPLDFCGIAMASSGAFDYLMLNFFSSNIRISDSRDPQHVWSPFPQRLCFFLLAVPFDTSLRAYATLLRGIFSELPYGMQFWIRCDLPIGSPYLSDPDDVVSGTHKVAMVRYFGTVHNVADEIQTPGHKLNAGQFFCL